MSTRGSIRLDDVAVDPAKALSLSRDQVRQLVVANATVNAVLLGRLLDFDPGPTPATAAGPTLDGDEAAHYLRMKRSRLDALRRAGQIPALKHGKAFTYLRVDLDRFQATKPPEE